MKALGSNKANRKHWSALLTLFAAAVMTYGPYVKAQDGDAAVRIEEKKQADAELDLATRVADVKEYAGTSFQSEISQVSRKRIDLEKDIAYADTRAEFAKAQLEAAKAANDAAETKRWTDDLAQWTAKSETSKSALVGANNEYDALVASMKKAISSQSNQDVVLPGETMELFVAEDDSFNGRYQVRRGGYVILPRIGRVMLAGKSIKDAEAVVKHVLEETQLRNATVILERAQSLDSNETPTSNIEDTIYLAGAFLQPGYWTVPYGVKPTLLISLLRTGGVEKTADLHHVKVLRLINGRGLVEEVNVDAILKGRQTLTADLSLMNNDIVVVPDTNREDFFYITGNVSGQGVQVIPHGLIVTCYAGILRAGGFARFANLRRVYVLRDVGSGQRVRIPVNIHLVKKGLMPDLILDDQDIVIVPEKFFSF